MIHATLGWRHWRDTIDNDHENQCIDAKPSLDDYCGGQMIRPNAKTNQFAKEFDHSETRKAQDLSHLRPPHTAVQYVRKILGARPLPSHEFGKQIRLDQ